MNKKYIQLILCLLITGTSYGQFRIGTGTDFTTSSNTIIATDANITNQSTSADFINAHLHLLGRSQVLNTSSAISIGNVTIKNGGDRTISGEWVFLSNMTFTDGLLTPTSTGKIVYTGSAQLEGNQTSYVNGFFYSQGTGTRSYPIGSNGLFAPAAILSGAPTVLGIRLMNGDPGIMLPADISETLTTHYWEFVSENAADISSTVALSTINLGALAGLEDLVVVHGDPISGNGTNLGGSNTGPFINSQRGTPAGLLTIGRGEKINLVIHDMITPFNKDGINDVLAIDNIELTETNKVSLLDRYGTVVKEWTDYNLQDPGVTTPFDFGLLTPGNYICVLEYTLLGGSTTEKISQMVTILQTN